MAGRSRPKEGPGLGFFLFPFQADKQQPAATGRQAIHFRVEVTFAPPCTEGQRAEVASALAAWIALGGIGARTRRGCGALTATEMEWLPPTPQQFEGWLKQRVEGTGDGAHFPVLRGAYGIVGPGQREPGMAWEALARFWAAFRKGHVANDYNPMNGSHWNDYDFVSDAGREQGIALAKPFLGMPIIFQQGRKYSGEVEPGESGRMASPVILKPLAMADKRYYPLVLVLAAPVPKQVKLKGGRVYALRRPTADPVLLELGCTDPLEAVVVAAERHFAQHTRFSLKEAR
jgi:CRISPR-associated protein Cmr1